MALIKAEEAVKLFKTEQQRELERLPALMDKLSGQIVKASGEGKSRTRFGLSSTCEAFFDEFEKQVKDAGYELSPRPKPAVPKDEDNAGTETSSEDDEAEDHRAYYVSWGKILEFKRPETVAFIQQP